MDTVRFELTLYGCDRFNAGERFGRVVRPLLLGEQSGGVLVEDETFVSEPDLEGEVTGAADLVRPAPEAEWEDARSALAAAPRNRMEYLRAKRLLEEAQSSPHSDSEPVRRRAQFYADVVGHFAVWFHENGIPLPDETRDAFGVKIDAIMGLLSVRSASDFQNVSSLYRAAAERYGVVGSNDPADTYRVNLRDNFKSRYGIGVPKTPEEWAEFVERLRAGDAGVAEREG